MFRKKLKMLSGIKTKKLTFFEYKQSIQSCVGTFALDSLILCLLVKLELTLQVCVLPMTLKETMIQFLVISKMNEI